MKVTKRAKEVYIIEKLITVIKTSYVCPTCHTQVQEDINDRVVRFKCSYCRQELIAIHEYSENNSTNEKKYSLDMDKLRKQQIEDNGM